MDKIDALTISIGADTSKLDKALDGIASKLNQVKSSAESIKMPSTTVESIQGVEKSLQEVSEEAKKTAKAVDSATASISKVSKAELENAKHFVELSRKNWEKGAIDKSAFNYTIDEAKKNTSFFKALADSLSKTHGPAKTASKHFAKLASSFARIMTYRAIRKVISEVTESLREGTQNLYQWANAVGANFASTMDTFKTQTTYFKNGLASMFSPLIEWVVPHVIVPATDALVDFFNIVQQGFASLTGQSYWYKAEKSVQKYGDAVKKATVQLMGFDEINNLTDGAGSSSNDASGMFSLQKEVAGEGSVPELFTRVADALKKIKDNAEPIWNALKPVAEWLGSTALEVAVSGFESLGKFFEDYGEDIADDLTTIWNAMTPFMNRTKTRLINLIAGAFDSLGEGIKACLDPIAGILDGFDKLSHGDFWGWIDSSAQGIIKSFQDVNLFVLKAIRGIISVIDPNSPLIAAIDNLIDDVKGAGDDIVAISEQTAHTLETDFASLQSGIKGQIKNSDIPEAYRESAAKAVALYVAEKWDNGGKVSVDGIKTALWNGGIPLAYQDEAAKAILSFVTGVNGGKPNLAALGGDLGTLFGSNFNTKFKALTTGLSIDVVARVASIDTSILSSSTASVTGFEVRNKTPIRAYADGGYVQGSMFVAGEVPGQAEMVGNINGHTGVASGAEITGIRDAIIASGQNEEMLLNRLITALERKQLVITPSTALGRVVSQSSKMYSTALG